MAAITEDYVSFEIAKLLKEKGFDVNVINSWHIVPSETCNFEDLEKVICGDINEPEYSEDYYPMITLQMAMKWLREAHNICITIYPDKEKEYEAVLYDIKNDAEIILQSFGIYGVHIFGDSYEQACEAAIKYCLENLI